MELILTIGVDNRNDVKVIVVQRRSGALVASLLVSLSDLVEKVLNSLKRGMSANLGAIINQGVMLQQAVMLRKQRETYDTGDPLASVDIAVPDDGRLLASTLLAVEVDALDVAALDGLSSDEGLGVVGEVGADVIKELVVICKLMVRVEVRDVWKLGRRIGVESLDGC